MEEAQRKLFEAAAKGCITSVKQLMIDDPSIHEALKLLMQTISSDNSESKEGKKKKKKTKKKSLEDTIKEWLEKKKNSLMVVASLLATMCFQIGVSPPGGVWQDDNYLVDSQGNMVDLSGNPSLKAMDAEGKDVSYPHKAGCSVLASKNPAAFEAFYISNTIGFLSSLSIIFLFMSGLPVRSRFFMWILMVITWIAISATAWTYNVVVMALTPKGSHVTEAIIGCSLYVWIGLTVLIFIVHLIRLVKKLIMMLFRALLKLVKLPFNCCKAASSPPV